jgi:hypothetical protein
MSSSDAVFGVAIADFSIKAEHGFPNMIFDCFRRDAKSRRRLPIGEIFKSHQDERCATFGRQVENRAFDAREAPARRSVAVGRRRGARDIVPVDDFQGDMPALAATARGARVVQEDVAGGGEKIGALVSDIIAERAGREVSINDLGEIFGVRRRNSPSREKAHEGAMMFNEQRPEAIDA